MKATLRNYADNQEQILVTGTVSICEERDKHSFYIAITSQEHDTEIIFQAKDKNDLHDFLERIQRCVAECDKL